MHSEPSSVPRTWQALWSQRGQRELGRAASALRNAMDADGFDSGPGFLDEETYRLWASHAMALLRLEVDHDVLDCGSGAGAMSMLLTLRARSCVSVDYAWPLLRLGMRLGTLSRPVVGEAAALPFADNAFDRVICTSVAQYFPDLPYAIRVVSEMLRVSRSHGRILIMDIPDATYKLAALAERQDVSGHTYSKLTMEHMYYRRESFRDLENHLSCNITIVDHDLSTDLYGNAAYRFHVVLEKL